MDFLSRMSAVVDYIEEHITEDMDFNGMAKLVSCGVYQFGRIFSYVVGLSLSDYIRRRRLSLAALELQEGAKVIDVALKYGYSSPDSFARAFGNMHGITPKEASAKGASLRLYPCLSFQISIKGDVDMEYRLEQKTAITVVGVVKNFGKWTANQEGQGWQDRMGDVWKFWNQYLDGQMNKVVRDKYKLYRAPFWQVGVTQTLDNGETVIAIGAESAGKEYPELETFEVPASTWAVFTARGNLDQDDHPMEALQTKIVSEWLPSSGYERSMNYELEVYGPGDTQDQDYTCEIWIPINKK